MAVQQNKPTRSKRGMRRSHDALTAVTSLSAMLPQCSKRCLPSTTSAILKPMNC